jgi:hypothetical protein
LTFFSLNGSGLNAEVFAEGFNVSVMKIHVVEPTVIFFIKILPVSDPILPGGYTRTYYPHQ